MQPRTCEKCGVSTLNPGSCHACGRPHDSKTVDRVLLGGLGFCPNPSCRAAIRLGPLPEKFSLEF